MTHLSVESIRKEIAERRDVVLRSQREEDMHRQAIERAETDIARRKAEVGSLQASITHQQQVIEALQAAAALLAERLPVGLEAPIPADPRLSIQKPEEAPKSASPTPSKAGTLVVHSRRQSESRKTGYERDQAHYVCDRAEQLDLSQVSREFMERADLVYEVLIEQGPSRQAELIPHVVELLECKKPTAQSIVSHVMAILYKQQRIRQVDDNVAKVTWEAVIKTTEGATA